MTGHPTAEIARTTEATGSILTTASSFYFYAQVVVPYSGTLTAGRGILLQAMAPFHKTLTLTTDKAKDQMRLHQTREVTLRFYSWQPAFPSPQVSGRLLEERHPFSAHKMAAAPQ